MTDFYNARAVKLSPKDYVLFLFNYATGMNINSFEVDVSAPVGVDAEGRTQVDITGRDQVGPNGDGGYSGVTRFAYRRTPLSIVGLPSDGSFFDPLGSRPSFLAILAEFKRRTQFNCTVEDFIPTEYRTDNLDGYTLKASPTSLRFEGEVLLGNPRRANLDQFLADPSLTLDFSDYDGVFDLNINRVPTSYDLTGYPGLISQLSVGYTISPSDLLLFNVLLGQADYSGVSLTDSPTPNAFLNINGMQVIYHGPLRPEADDRHWFTSRDRVIELLPSPVYAPKAFGSLKLYYASSAGSQPIQASEKVYALNLAMTDLSGTSFAAFWASAQVGQLLDEVGAAGDVAQAFEAAFGLTYDLVLYRSLKVTYNGPLRPSDVAIDGLGTGQVVELTPVANPATHLYGPAKVYY